MVPTTTVLVLILALVEIFAHTETVPPYMIQKAFSMALQDLNILRESRRYFYEHGVDSASSDSHLWHHARFMFAGDKDRISSLGENAFVATTAAKYLSKMTLTPLNILQSDPNVLLTWRHTMAPICTQHAPVCNIKARFRTFDGTCNNILHATWGAAFRPQRRFLPHFYQDGFNTPRTLSVTGALLPSARLVSNVIHRDNSILPKQSNVMSVLFMTYGQFIDHDFIGTPMTKGRVFLRDATCNLDFKNNTLAYSVMHKKSVSESYYGINIPMNASFNGSDISCCTIPPHVASKRAACHPIGIPANDPRFVTRCMNFVRSVAAPADNCDLDVRQQMNQHSSYIDGSLIYGSTKIKNKQLRAFHGGLMKAGPFGLMPPTVDTDQCLKSKPQEYCFNAGDDRNSVVPTLASMHTIFLREHNRIATKLHLLNPTWKDERLFQETRKIVAAILQHITYNEYLPYVLGPIMVKKYDLCAKGTGYDTVYDPEVDATATNAFGVAAFRFGHSQIPNVQNEMRKDYKIVSANAIEATFNRPEMVFGDQGTGCDRINFWQINTYQSKQDRVLQDGVRNNLFLDKMGRSFDLAALNIQRGREHGIPPYNFWRKWCKLPVATHFGNGIAGFIDLDTKAAKLLSKVYSHPDDVDLFTGGLSERLLPGALTGPTFACIIARQFRNFKRGDRFWYENKFPSTGFTLEQVQEIKKTSMASILCANSKIKQIQARVFRVPTDTNPTTFCNSIPQMNLGMWAEDLSFSSTNLLPIINHSIKRIPYTPLSFIVVSTY